MAKNNERQRITPRSAATRARLVSVAERLFAERGVEGVPLSEINKTSGQRNANACQYHFGNREGLLQAIVDKHVPGIAARRAELLDELEQAGELSLEGLVDAWIEPVVEKLHDPDGGREFIRVNAQLTTRHMLSLLKPGQGALHAPGAGRLTSGWNQLLAHLPLAVRQQRLHLASILVFQGLADHSRLQEHLGDNDPAHDTQLFVATLRDAIIALLQQPPSADCLHSAEQAHATGD
ncbi:MAG: hypothetical protein CME40_01975 [Haliea sp.]|nr:hypothetical protein [Haliea sp.]|tara:strand:- start:110548 stop:111255 length:708 start_codon:yes stop_codon:yes gene_type:complete